LSMAPPPEPATLPVNVLLLTMTLPWESMAPPEMTAVFEAIVQFVTSRDPPPVKIAPPSPPALLEKSVLPFQPLRPSRSIPRVAPNDCL
jgi:hypothetical protein